ncbi:hypothetical protein SAMN05421820_101228 [Pedobacter steynii]|uniref:Uncharacterized protein n=1 Tax=Pedobacter steynii TaxID=430522 RepID=A0A1G9JEC9_9SPHI|nr:hypothetical protein [Pedobacter steynii]NQX38218.1 hypothetical protein [Pedobacter steynii]SDL35503.1 hypothetical protein SAMN05421820_101228 [Pedobacter steynii]
MIKTKLYNLLTIFILIMAIIQAPLIYYYTFGLFAFFIVIPYLIIGLGLTVWLLTVLLKNKISEMIRFQKLGVILTISIGSFTLFFGEDIIEKLDWQFRRNSREEIIELIKFGKLKPNVTHNNFICTLDNWDIPPISNGGNEIAIYKNEDNKLTVEFYIDRGFLGHYSAFVYTNDKGKIKELEEKMTLDEGLHVNKKLDENWYRVSY